MLLPDPGAGDESEAESRRNEQTRENSQDQNRDNGCMMIAGGSPACVLCGVRARKGQAGFVEGSLTVVHLASSSQLPSRSLSEQPVLWPARQ